MTSFREKSLWSQLLVTLFIGYYYFSSLLDLSYDQLSDAKVVSWLLVEIILVTIFSNIVAAIVLAILNPKQTEEKADERDRAISLRGGQYALCVLQFSVFAAIIHYGVEVNFEFDGFVKLLPFAPLHILVLGSLISELASFGRQLWLERNGVF